MKEFNESNLMFNQSEIRQQKATRRNFYQEDDDLLGLDYTSQTSNLSKQQLQSDTVPKSGPGMTNNLVSTSKFYVKPNEHNDYNILLKSQLDKEPVKSESIQPPIKNTLLGLLNNPSNDKLNFRSSTILPSDLQTEKFKEQNYGINELHHSVSSAPKPSLLERLRFTSLANSKQESLEPAKPLPKTKGYQDEEELDDILDFPQSISESFKSYANKEQAAKNDNLEIVTDLRNQFSEEEEFQSSSETEIQIEHKKEILRPVPKYTEPNPSRKPITLDDDESHLVDLTVPQQLSLPTPNKQPIEDKFQESNLFNKHKDQENLISGHEDEIPILILARNVPDKRITVTVADRLQQFKKVVFYKISGSYELPDDITSQVILHRYNDFKVLHILLGEQFYYKVLPRLPEKNILYKLKTSRQMLEQRAIHLENYLNKLLEIESVNTSDFLKQFLTDRDGFAWITQTPENALALQKEGMIQSTTSKINSIWNMIAQKDRLDDPGFYAVYAKEVDSFHLFLKNTLDNLLKLRENMKGLSQNVKTLTGISQAIKPKSVKPDSHSEEEQSDADKDQATNPPILGESLLTTTRSKVQQRPPSSPHLLDQIIIRLNDMLEDILSCKESLGRKDKIYREFEQAKNQYKNSQISRDITERNSVLIGYKKQIDELEQSFKPELSKKILAVKERLDDLMQHSLQSALVDAFRLE